MQIGSVRHPVPRLGAVRLLASFLVDGLAGLGVMVVGEAPAGGGDRAQIELAFGLEVEEELRRLVRPAWLELDRPPPFSHLLEAQVRVHNSELPIKGGCVEQWND